MFFRRSLKIVAESYAVKGLCLQKEPAATSKYKKAEREEEMSKCFDLASDLGLLYMQKLDREQINATSVTGNNATKTRDNHTFVFSRYSFSSATPDAKDLRCAFGASAAGSPSAFVTKRQSCRSAGTLPCNTLRCGNAKRERVALEIHVSDGRIAFARFGMRGVHTTD